MPALTPASEFEGQTCNRGIGSAGVCAPSEYALGGQRYFGPRLAKFGDPDQRIAAVAALGAGFVQQATATPACAPIAIGSLDSIRDRVG
jgi:hypothetical protein